MLSRPDIVVAKPESSEVLLAVEVECIAAQASADGLREYTVRQNCPAGILVSPETILFLTNRYTEFRPLNWADGSVRHVGIVRPDGRQAPN
jgi:hypothetical protein